MPRRWHSQPFSVNSVSTNPERNVNSRRVGSTRDNDSNFMKWNHGHKARYRNYKGSPKWNIWTHKKSMSSENIKGGRNTGVGPTGGAVRDSSLLHNIPSGVGKDFFTAGHDSNEHSDSGKRSPWLKEIGGSLNPPVSSAWARDPLNPSCSEYGEDSSAPQINKDYNLWNRRRTNSVNSIPTLSAQNHRPRSPRASSPSSSSSPYATSPGSESPTTAMNANSTLMPASSQRGSRGSSTSPHMPQTSGFWVQDPDDSHKLWIRTGLDNPSSQDGDSALRVSSPTWSTAAENANQVSQENATMVTGGSYLIPNQNIPSTSQIGSNIPGKRLFKTQSTWMSGSGDNEDGQIFDFQNRVKIFQPDNKISSGSRSSGITPPIPSSANPVKTRGIQHHTQASSSHSLSRSNVSSSEVMTSSKSLSKGQSASSTTKSSTNLSELKSSMSEVKSNISEMTQQANTFSRTMSSSSSSKSAGLAGLPPTAVTSKMKALKSLGSSMGSLECLGSKIGSCDQLAMPDIGSETQDLVLATGGDNLTDASLHLRSCSPLSSQKELKFEEKKVTSSSKTKVVTDKNSFESASGQSSESRKLQSGDVSYEESSRTAAMKAKLEMDGITAEKAAANQEEMRQLRAGDVVLREGSQKKGAAVSLAGEGFAAHKAAMSEQQQRQAITSAGTINQESSRKALKSGVTITTKGVCTKQSSHATSSEDFVSFSCFEDLDSLGEFSQPMDIQNAVMNVSSAVSGFVEKLKDSSMQNGVSILDRIDGMMKKAWSVPTYGNELGSSLCDVLRHNGGLDMLIENCSSFDDEVKLKSAKVLEQCMSTENRGYVVDNALKAVVDAACDCAKDCHSAEKSQVGTGILAQLFKHDEGTCSDIIKLGGLDAVLSECRNTDKTTLQHCAGALANLSLYGGSENHKAMMKQNVEYWLFPLAFHENTTIKYYACLAIAALVANKEIEAAVTKSGTLSLVEPFVTAHLPEDFANIDESLCRGQSKSWLRRLVSVLSSEREEARSLAAFHFCMEAGIKKKEGKLDLFREIGAIEPLKKVASSPNAIASEYAARALDIMGEEVPHKLSQQVPLWSVEDVKEWVKQIGFGSYSDAFGDSRVDGDLLLNITDTNLKEDIGITNGILRQRFLRDLRNLKQIADYTSCDSSFMNEFLTQLDPAFAEYTYPLVQAGVSQDLLRFLKEEQLTEECNVLNSFHRQKILNAALGMDQTTGSGNVEKDLDVFISYRRSSGSQLASLLKVHMCLRGFSTFIDVERLEAGKFDNNLLNSIRQAKHFLLVLTTNALDRCIGDIECKDWVHREILAALQSGCNIIPIIDNFQWPEPEQLPEDMRSICYFNGVRWIHDYQDACVDKVERFMRGEGVISRDALGRHNYGGSVGGTFTPAPGTPSTMPRAPVYQRTTSIESGKGSSCSDKDLSKD